MVDMDRLALGTLRQKGRDPHLFVTPQDWGYVIGSGNKPPLDVIIGQVLSYFLGVCFVSAGLGLMLFSGWGADADLGPMRIGAATLFGAGATYLLWFSSRGGRIDIQVDTKLKEIREVVQNRVGNPSIISRYAFQDIGGVFVEPASGRSPAQLVLGYRGKMILVADGATHELDILRNQLSRDLMGPMGLELATRPDASRNRSLRDAGRAA